MENEDITLEHDEEAHQPLTSGFVAVLYGKAAFNLLASLACFFFIASMLFKPAVRNNPHNLFVIFMILPDGVNTFIKALANLFVANNHGVKWFPPGDYFYSYYYHIDLFFWMFNYAYPLIILTYEIEYQVQCYRNAKWVSPPTIHEVSKQVTVVFLCAIFVSLLVFLPDISHITDERRAEGEGDVSLPGGWFNSLSFIWIALSSTTMPVAYVLFERIRIWKRKLLPETERTKVLSLFFLRVTIIFVLFYGPSVVLTYQRSRMDDDPVAVFWVDTILGILAACQALPTLFVIWRLKGDIREAVKTAWGNTFGRLCCCCSFFSTTPHPMSLLG